MFVLRHVFVFVNPPLIVESFGFLVHMKFGLLKDTSFVLRHIECLVLEVTQCCLNKVFICSDEALYCWQWQLTCSGSDTCVDIIMSVVKYVLVLVNSSLIVESLVFLVHMQIFLLKDICLVSVWQNVWCWKLFWTHFVTHYRILHTWPTAAQKISFAYFMSGVDMS